MSSPVFPILRAGSRRPPLPPKGIVLAGPEGNRCQVGGPAWFQGSLVAPAAPGEGERWLRSIFVTAAAEDAEGARTMPLVRGDHPLHGAPPVVDKGQVTIDFQFDAAELFGHELPAGGHFVHVTAQLFRSEVVHLTCEEGKPADPPVVTRPPAVDALVLAYHHARLGQHERAAARFVEALADETLRADLDRGCLYHAACSASIAAGAATGERRAGLARFGLTCLKDDLERRRAALQRRVLTHVDREVGGQLTELEREEEEALRDAVVAHLRAARSEDPDLATLRESEFGALFGR